MRALSAGLALILTLNAWPAMALAADAAAEKPATVQLAPVAMPIVVDGRLVNYVFVTVKLTLAKGVEGAVVRDKEAFFRDALVRAGHHTPFVVATDYTKADVAKIRAEVLKDAPQFVGRGVVANAEITKQVSQTKAYMIPQPPKPGAPAPRPQVREPEIIP